MKGIPFLSNYLDPIARVWGYTQPALPSRQFKAAARKTAPKKTKK